MKFFKPWTWFQSEERQLKRKQMELDIERARLQIELLRSDLERANSRVPLVADVEKRPIDAGYSNASFDLGEIKVTKPYKSLRLMDETVMVTMNDGSVFTKEDGGAKLFSAVKNATSEKEVENLFFIKLKDEPEEKAVPERVEIETPEQREIVKKYSDILFKNPDFEFTGEDVYLKGVSLALPAPVLGSFIEIEEKKSFTNDVKEKVNLDEYYQALKMFWYWTALNPIEESRRDLLSFVKNKDITITKNGLLEMYRRIVKVGDRTEESLVTFVSEQYAKVKKAKKGPANFLVVKFLNEYKLVKDGKSFDGESVGNLADLYQNLSNFQSNRYTDAHTRKKDIRIGQVYREDEEHIDLNNQVECSRGLHVGSHEFGFGGFGDTGVLVLVNPSKVRSVPVHDTNKMRVSEMFIVGAMDLEEYKDQVTKEAVVNDYSTEYFNQSLNELSEAVKNKTFEKSYSCQGKVSLVDPAKIKTLLSNKVVEI